MFAGIPTIASLYIFVWDGFRNSSEGGGAQLFGSRRPEGHQFFAPLLYAKIENKTSLYFSKLDSQNKNFQGFNYFVTQFPDPLNS